MYVPSRTRLLSVSSQRSRADESVVCQTFPLHTWTPWPLKRCELNSRMCLSLASADGKRSFSQKVSAGFRIQLWLFSTRGPAPERHGLGLWPDQFSRFTQLINTSCVPSSVLQTICSRCRADWQVRRRHILDLIHRTCCKAWDPRE